MAESHAGRNLEGELVGIHRMEGAVEQFDLHGRHLVAGQTAIGHRRLEALLHGRHILFWHIAALDLIDKLQTGDTFVGRTDFNNDISELATAARLLLEDFTMLDGRRDGFLVIDLGSTLVDLDAKLTTETVDDDIQMKLAHTADDGLAGLSV